MPHVQARLDDATFKEVKKDALEKDVTLGDYVKDAVVKQLERSKEERCMETVDQTNLNSQKGD